MPSLLPLLACPLPQAQVSSLESQLAEAQADREQLRGRLDKTTADLDAQLAASGQQRQQLAAAQQAERDLHAACRAAEAAAAQSSRQVCLHCAVLQRGRRAGPLCARRPALPCLAISVPGARPAWG